MTIVEEMEKEYNRYISIYGKEPRYIVMSIDKFSEFIKHRDQEVGNSEPTSYFRESLILPTYAANGSLIKAFS